MKLKAMWEKAAGSRSLPEPPRNHTQVSAWAGKAYPVDGCLLPQAGVPDQRERGKGTVNTALISLRLLFVDAVWPAASAPAAVPAEPGWTVASSHELK